MLERIPDCKRTTEIWHFWRPKDNSQTQLRHRRNLLRSWLAISYQNNLSTGNTNILPPHISSSSRFARLGSSAAFPCAMAYSRHCLEKRLLKYTRKKYYAVALKMSQGKPLCTHAQCRFVFIQSLLMAWLGLSMGQCVFSSSGCREAWQSTLLCRSPPPESCWQLCYSLPSSLTPKSTMYYW